MGSRREERRDGLFFPDVIVGARRASLCYLVTRDGNIADCFLAPGVVGNQRVGVGYGRGWEEAGKRRRSDDMEQRRGRETKRGGEIWQGPALCIGGSQRLRLCLLHCLACESNFDAVFERLH